MFHLICFPPPEWSESWYPYSWDNGQSLRRKVARSLTLDDSDQCVSINCWLFWIRIPGCWILRYNNKLRVRKLQQVNISINFFFFFLNLEKVNDKRDESDAVHSCSSQWWLFSLVVESSEQSALFHFTDQLNKSVGHRVACVRTWLHFMLHSAQSHERISFCSAFPLYL